MNRVAPTAVTHGLEAGHDAYNLSPGTGGGPGGGPGGPGGGGPGGALLPLVAFGSCDDPVMVWNPKHSWGLKSAPATKVQYL
mmetsp:Transcript_40052/g.55874  ORF Transcript_40052/g.55874 Transcript_40052/m.55874 type:complete len:82 (-) Transcript_40052:1263-1508(-)